MSRNFLFLKYITKCKTPTTLSLKPKAPIVIIMLNVKSISSVITRLTASSDVVNAYNSVRGSLTDKGVRYTVLERGTTDFDKPYKDTDPIYKAWVYVSVYMRMHYDANKAMFGECNFADIGKITFMDFGCGPMTSGMALLASLGKTNSAESIHYVGVDISKNMLVVAKQINDEHRLFESCKFYTDFYAAVIKCIETSAINGRSVIINFSYVLSADTLKGENALDAICRGVVELARAVLDNSGCSVYVTYLNPLSIEGNMINNWIKFSNRLDNEFEISESACGAINYGYPRSAYRAVIQLLKK